MATARRKKTAPPPVSVKTVAKGFLSALVLWLVYIFSHILMLVLVAVYMAAIIEPWVDKLHARRIPRALSTLGIFLALFAIISSAIVLVLPTVIDQGRTMSREYPVAAEAFSHLTDSAISPAQAQSDAISLPGAVTSAEQGSFLPIVNLFGGIFSLAVVLIVAFYFVVDQGAVKRNIAMLPKKYRLKAERLYRAVYKRTGHWLRGQFVLMAMVTLTTYVLFTVAAFAGFVVPHPFILSLVAGLLELIPYIGLIVSGAIATAIAATINTPLAALVAIIFFIVYITEANVFAPKLLPQSASLSPLIALLVLLLGIKFAGLTGAVIAIPLATTTAVVVQEVNSGHEVTKKQSRVKRKTRQ